LRIDIITIFPEYFAPLGVSLIGKAAQRGDISFGVHDLRTWAHDPHHSVDDSPFGGGPGMVMRPEPWGEALDALVPAGRAARLVLPSPSGVPFTQQMAAEYAQESHLVFACGRYEGIDARVAEEARSRMAVDEVTIGDYVLAGGEPAVLVITEAVCRLLPGVIGNADSASDDSFGGGSGPMAGLIEGRPIPGRGSGAGGPCRRSCCPATTRPSPGGVAMPRCAGRPPTARTWPPGWRARGWKPATGRCSLRLVFHSAAKIWQTESAAPPDASGAGRGRARCATAPRPIQRVRRRARDD